MTNLYFSGSAFTFGSTFGAASGAPLPSFPSGRIRIRLDGRYVHSAGGRKTMSRESVEYLSPVRRNLSCRVFSRVNGGNPGAGGSTITKPFDKLRTKMLNCVESLKSRFFGSRFLRSPGDASQMATPVTARGNASSAGLLTGIGSRPMSLVFLILR